MTELSQYGNLLDFLKNNEDFLNLDKQSSFKVRVSISLQIAQAIAYLHKHA